jgi:Fe-coproporphyrin III synthase
MVTLAEAGRRALTQVNDRLQSLPILALSVHSACNCHCVMCDIWKANSDKREIPLEELEHHVAALRGLHVQRVMLTGGEPLLHGNLWALCDLLREEEIKITLVTTGLLLAPHATAIARTIDELVVSIDGPPDVHDGIRRVKDGFHRIARGLQAVLAEPTPPTIIARSVVQRANHGRLVQTVEAVRRLGVDRLSFLAADVTSHAFNRPQPWSAERAADVALSRDQVFALAATIAEVEDRCGEAIERGFIAGGVAALWRIRDYYAALAGMGAFPPVRCNAPWVSAVLEPGGSVRPCFFHPPYSPQPGADLIDIVNSPQAIAFRRSLSIESNETCRRCVCSLALPMWREA